MIRRERPAGLRLSCGEEARAGGYPTRVFHFLVKTALVEDKDIRYPVNGPMTQALAKTTQFDGPLEEFRPTRVPVRLLSGQPFRDGWYEARLSSYLANCTSDCVIPRVGPFVEKTREFLEQDEQAKPLEARGIVIPEDDLPDYEGQPELWLGKATRYEDDGSGHKRSRRIVCDPLVCPHFRNPNDDKPCRPHIQLHFGLTWASGYNHGSYVSRAWCTMHRLTTSLADCQQKAASYGLTLANVPAWLYVEPRRVMDPDGKRRKQPCIGMELDETALVRLSERRAALPEAMVSEVAALPSIHELLQDRGERRALLREFEPEAMQELLSAEDALWQRYEDKLTRAAFESVLAAHDDDLDGAEAALQAMVENHNGQGRLL